MYLQIILIVLLLYIAKLLYNYQQIIKTQLNPSKGSSEKNVVALQIKPSTISGAGNGVFTNTNIKAGDCVESCPLLILTREHIKDSEIFHYVFNGDLFQKKTDSVDLTLPKLSVFPLGYGGLYNHSNSPNCIQATDEEQKLMYIMALKDIPVNSELFLNYGDGWWESRNQTPT